MSEALAKCGNIGGALASGAGTNAVFKLYRQTASNWKTAFGKCGAAGSDGKTVPPFVPEIEIGAPECTRETDDPIGIVDAKRRYDVSSEVLGFGLETDVGSIQVKSRKLLIETNS